MIDQLKLKLASHGIDTSTLTPLDEIISENNKHAPIYTLSVDLDNAVPLWQQLRVLRDEFGYSPVILGDEKSLVRHRQGRENAESPTTYLEDARKCDTPSWFQEQWEGLFDDDSFTEDDIRGDWDTEVKPYTKLNLSHLHLNPMPIQYIGFLAATVNADLPAYLPFGGWNACPTPDEHVSIQHYWHTLYQTEIVAMLSDTLVCYVGNPVKEREAALTLARQHMDYCEDRVTQGMGTLDALASALINSSYWTFWWD